MGNVRANIPEGRESRGKFRLTGGMSGQAASAAPVKDARYRFRAIMSIEPEK
jgi:hypothetical protein